MLKLSGEALQGGMGFGVEPKASTVSSPYSGWETPAALLVGGFSSSQMSVKRLQRKRLGVQSVVASVCMQF